MSQATQVLIGTVFGLSGIAALISIRLFPRRRTAPASVPTAVIRTGYRWCPIEQRSGFAFLREDGSAVCADDDCRAYIPATEEEPRA